MPIYEFRCTSCDSTETKICSIREHGKPGFRPVCCESEMVQLIYPVHGHVRKSPHYICPATKEQVTSWRQRANLFDKHDLMDVSDMNMDRDEETGAFKHDKTNPSQITDSNVWSSFEPHEH